MAKPEDSKQSLQSKVPSVDKVLRQEAVLALAEIYGRTFTTHAVKVLIDEVRAAIKENGEGALERLS